MTRKTSCVSAISVWLLLPLLSVFGQPMPDLLPSIHDGGAAIGHSYIDPEHDWKWFFCSTERAGHWVKITPREAANRQGGLLIHNPGSRFTPMDLNQFVKTTAQAMANPSDAALQASADWSKFISSASKFRADGLWLGAYVGAGELTLPPLENESACQWADRAQAALAPLLYIRPRINWIGFDHVLGEPYDESHPQHSVTGGSAGGQAILMRRLASMGIETACEPTVRRDACWLRRYSAILTDKYLALNTNRGRWYGRDKTGAIIPTMDPTDLSGRPIVFDRTTWKQTNAEKWAAIHKANESGYAVAYTLPHFPEPEEE